MTRAVLIGAGHMGAAIARGWARAHAPADLHIVEADAARRAALASEGFPVAAVLGPATPAMDAVILAVKPGQVAAVAEAARASVASVEGTVVVSIAAGVTLQRLAALFPGAAVVRAMPNTAAAIGRSITVWVAEAGLSDAALGHVATILSTLGAVERAPDEAAMDAVTAVSGSGPAYVYALVEALAAAGVAQGLPAALAVRLARETLIGAGRMLEARSDTPAALRAAVTSPAGATAAGLAVLLGPDGLEPLMRRTVEAAAARSQALGAPDEDRAR